MVERADRSWIEPLILALERPAYQFAVLLVRDSSVAQEMVQEAFVRVWQSPGTPRDLSSFRPWLYKTLVNLVRDHHRKRRRWERLPFVRPLPLDPTELVERHLADAELARAIRSLREREREALYVRFFEDAPYNEVARILGVRSGAARVVVHRALRKLRRQLASTSVVEVVET